MAYLIKQMHVRIDEDNEIITKIDEMLLNFPDRFRTQSDVIRASINYMHRYELIEGGKKHDREKTSMRFTIK